MSNINIKLDIIRDRSNISKSINVILEKHSDFTDLTNTYNDEDGVEQSYKYDGVVNNTKVDSRSFVYHIPEEQQTNLQKGPEHPHNTANEQAYQEKYLLWLAGIRISEAFIQAKSELIGE
jgi:hypothetical protein